MPKRQAFSNAVERLKKGTNEAAGTAVMIRLKSRWIAVDSPKSLNIEAYRKKIANIGVWTDEDVRVFDDNRKVLDNFNPQEW